MKVSRLEGLVLENAQAQNLVSEAQVSSARAAHKAALASGEPSNFFAHLAERLDPAARASVREIYQTALRDEFGGETVATEPPQPRPSGLDAVAPRSQLATVAEPPSVVGEALPTIPGYRIEDELGRGGMGVVYRAVSEASGEQVALKVLLAGSKATSEDLVRFRTEAEVAERLEHPHIVALLEHGEANGNPYMVLEYVEGEDLESRISRGKLEPADAVEIASGLADALTCAHEQGILHRDFKPQNVLLDREGHPLLTDFGLAKLRGDAAPTLSLTQSGMMLGTPAYMAPEQANAERKNIDERTDVYGLGATLYHMLTGQRPFNAPTLASLVVKILNEPPPRPRSLVPDLDPALETIVLKCLEKDRSDRYPTARALQRDLNRWERNLAIVAAPPTLVTRAQRVARRNPAAVGAGAFAVLMLVVALVFGYRSMRAEAELEAKLASLEGKETPPEQSDPKPDQDPETEEPEATQGEPSLPIEPPAEEHEPLPPSVTPEDPDPAPARPEPDEERAPLDPLPDPEPPSLPSPPPLPSPLPIIPDPTHKALPAHAPPPLVERRMLRLASGHPKHGFVASWQEGVQEAYALRLPLVVVALGTEVTLPGDAQWLELLRERAVVALARASHRTPANLFEACNEHEGLTCGDHVGVLAGAFATALLGGKKGRRRGKAGPRRRQPSEPYYLGVHVFAPAYGKSKPSVVHVGSGGPRVAEDDFKVTHLSLREALDEVQRSLGPSPLPLGLVQELGDGFWTLQRLKAGDPELSDDALGEAAERLMAHEGLEGPVGDFARYALRELCRTSLERSERRGTVADDLSSLVEWFADEPECALRLRRAKSRLAAR